MAVNERELKNQILIAMRTSRDPKAVAFRKATASLSAASRAEIEEAAVEFMTSDVIFDVSLQAMMVSPSAAAQVMTQNHSKARAVEQQLLDWLQSYFDAQELAVQQDWKSFRARFEMPEFWRCVVCDSAHSLDMRLFMLDLPLKRAGLHSFDTTMHELRTRTPALSDLHLNQVLLFLEAYIKGLLPSLQPDEFSPDVVAQQVRWKEALRIPIKPSV